VAAWGYLVSALRRPLLNAVPLVSNIERRSDPESDRLRIERRGAAASRNVSQRWPRRVNQLASGPFLCADRSGTGDWSRNCLVTGDGGWHVTLAQTQSTGDPVQRVAGSMVDRIFCRVRSTCRALATRACLTRPTLESAPARLPRERRANVPAICCQSGASHPR
jgi:hypothetical protein